MKKLISVLLAAVMAFGLFACGAAGGTDDQTADKTDSTNTTEETGGETQTTISSEPDENGLIFPAGEPETTSLVLHCPKDYNMSAQAVTAYREGYFKEAGLDVEIMWYQNGGDIPTSIIAGGADLAFGSWVNPMQVEAYGVPTEIICNTGDPAGTLSLIAAPGSGIESVADIQGKTITLTNAAVVVRTFKNICELYGIDYDSLDIVNAAPSDGVTAFINGDVDAVFTWQPYCANAIIKGGGKEIINGLYDYSNGGQEPVSGVYITACTFFGTKAFVDANPNTVARVVWALSKATCDLQDDSKIDAIAELTADDIGAETEVAAAAMRSMVYTMEMTQDWVDTLVSEVPYYLEIGSLPKEVDAASMVNTEFLDMVCPQWNKLS